MGVRCWRSPVTGRQVAVFTIGVRFRQRCVLSPLLFIECRPVILNLFSTTPPLNPFKSRTGHFFGPTSATP